MQDNYIPILVQVDGKKELWRFDLTDLSIAQLSEIKEAIQSKEPYTRSIVALDRLIRKKVEEMTMPYNKVYGKSYIKTYKENKKQEKNKKEENIGGK